MKFQAQHKQAVAAALQEARVPGSIVSKSATLIEKILELGEAAEARLDQFLGSLAQHKKPKDGKSE